MQRSVQCQLQYVSPWNGEWGMDQDVFLRDSLIAHVLHQVEYQEVVAMVMMCI